MSKIVLSVDVYQRLSVISKALTKISHKILISSILKFGIKIIIVRQLVHSPGLCLFLILITAILSNAGQNPSTSQCFIVPLKHHFSQ